MYERPKPGRGSAGLGDHQNVISDTLPAGKVSQATEVATSRDQGFTGFLFCASPVP